MTNFNYGKVVSFTNVTSEDFTHSYDGNPFTVKAGETVMFPFDLADHLATHLARKILIKNDGGLSYYNPKDESGGLGTPIWNAGDEAKLKTKILGTAIDNQETPKNELEVLREKMAILEERFLKPQEIVSKSEEKRLDVQTSDLQDGLSKPKVSNFNLPKRGEIIEMLDKKGIKYDPSLNKSELFNLLNDAN